jgi:hypothetical protein
MMKRNREGNLVGDVTRECSSSTCDNIFTITSKTVTLCPHCNSERVKSAAPEKKMLARARSRAKERGHEFNLELSDIHIPTHCPVLGIELVAHKGRSGGNPNSPALDRIDNNKGYVKGNVMVVSHRANMMKVDASPEELIKFAEWVLTRYR